MNGGIIIPVSATDVYKLVISNFVIIFRNCTHNYNSLQPGSKCSDYITQTQTSAICVVNLENVHHASPSQILLPFQDVDALLNFQGHCGELG